MAEIDIEKTPVSAVEVDLDKARDEKCIPIAKEILKDIALNLIPEDSNDVLNHNSLLVQVLTRALAADLNITTEASYLFQLVLGGLSGLNATIQLCTIPKNEDVRYKMIARKILIILSETDARLNEVTPEQTIEDFSGAKEKLNALFVEENLSKIEVKYIMDSIFSAFTNFNNAFSQSLEQSSQRAEAKLFGIDSMADLTMKKLNEVLEAK